ncbi:MAG: FG-GAP repeat protein [Candidatus Latescibacterota bacterium]|nr:MAG: FG-GAP repeat protein [Candidatus Latescibacterota bacterium]
MSYNIPATVACLWCALTLCVLALPVGSPRAGTIDLALQAPDHVLYGVGEDDYAGQAVLLCDFDGDGRDDIVVGARGFDFGDRGNCGIVYVLLASDTLGNTIGFDAVRPDLKRVVGPAANAQIGTVVGCGDVDNDGRDDIVCGIPLAAPNEKTAAGEVYVIFGSESPPDTIDLLTLPDGVTRIEGANVFDQLGASVAIADIDNDTYGDIIAGAPFSDTPAGSYSGRAVIIFGGSTLGSVIYLAAATTKIVQVFGAHPNDFLGGACYAAELTGDNIADLVLGAPQESPLGRSFAGVGYIVPGSQTFPDTIDLASDPPLGITRIYGPQEDALAGSGFASGDVNGDKLPELIVAVPEAAPDGRTGAGSIYVLDPTGIYPPPVSGGTGPGSVAGAPWPAIIDLASPLPANSTRIDGPATNMKIGSSIAVSDFNGDEYGDIVVGVHLASAPQVITPRQESGITHILFGRAVFSEFIDLADGQTGRTAIFGANSYDHFGFSAAAGRLDGDDYADLLIGANNATVDDTFSAGEVVVLFGSAEITPTAVLFYDAVASPGLVTVEWALIDDLDPGDIVVTRSPDGGIPLNASITRLGAGHYALTDTDVEGGTTYTYQAATIVDPQILFQVTVNVPRFGSARFHPNSPNPFRRSTAFSFEIPAEGRVQIRVFDVTGSLVAVLADDTYPPGESTVVWDGSATASGIYFARMVYGKQSFERKILIVR